MESESETKHVFEKGDVISTLSKKDIRVILDCKDDLYSFLHLKEDSIRDVFNNKIIFKKGSESKQPCDIVDRYFALMEL
jgi:hypothetical protein